MAYVNAACAGRVTTFNTGSKFPRASLLMIAIHYSTIAHSSSEPGHSSI